MLLRRGYYRPPDKIHGCFAGSGTLLNDPAMGPHVIKLTGKSDPRDVTVVYLGTPSYDLVDKRENQTSWYTEQGCTVIALDVVLNAPETSYMKDCMKKADIIIVSGGNTYYAMRRWKHIGLDKMLKEACLGPRRAVMAGGSAGAIWWVTILCIETTLHSTMMDALIRLLTSLCHLCFIYSYTLISAGLAVATLIPTTQIPIRRRNCTALVTVISMMKVI